MREYTIASQYVFIDKAKLFIIICICTSEIIIPIFKPVFWYKIAISDFERVYRKFKMAIKYSESKI